MRTIREMCKLFLAEQRELLKAGDRDALSPRTISDYTDALERSIIPAFGSMSLRAFQPTHAAQYLHAAKKAGRGIRANREVAALASAFNYAMALGKVAANPCRGVRRNRETPRTRSVSIEEVNEVIALAEKRGGAALMVAMITLTVALTGRRRNEILRLRREAVAEDGIRVSDTKTERHGRRDYLVRWSPLLREVVAKVDTIRGSGEYVFPTRTGLPYTDSGFKTEWSKLVRLYEAEGGLRFRPHDLRALYVSEMLDRGEDPNTHRNEATMRRVYDRRRVISVTPLA